MRMLSAETFAPPATQVFSFMCALAHQCFRNEYVFFQTEEEQKQVEQLHTRINNALENGHETPPALVALLACYRPLHRLPSCRMLLSDDPPSAGDSLFRRLIDRQIREPLEEKTIRGRIHRLTDIEDDTSSKVRSQYEENPYPRWTSLYYQTPRPFNVNMRTSYPYLAARNYPLPNTPEMLIAGCGTGRHVIGSATRFLDVKVLAIDLSLASLAYAVRKARELNVKNIEFAQADILELEGLGRHFDVIECGGVLHHLREPVRGWRILTGLLKPGGFMKLGLYSEIARQSVVAARQLITESGLGSSPDEIRLFRKHIIALPEDAPAKMVMRRFNDFYSTSDCRDLLFHVQEHRFTLPQIAETLNDLGLEFVGFEFGKSEKLADYRARFPDDSEAVNLQNWHRFELEQPDTFTSMYQFWVRKP
jgi:SAM-dependent methyltransferase